MEPAPTPEEVARNNARYEAFWRSAPVLPPERFKPDRAFKLVRYGHKDWHTLPRDDIPWTWFPCNDGFPGTIPGWTIAGWARWDEKPPGTGHGGPWKDLPDGEIKCLCVRVLLVSDSGEEVWYPSFQDAESILEQPAFIP